MSEVRLIVREAGQDWSGTVHGSLADIAIAALSADPVTLAELEAACARYHKPDPAGRFFSKLSRRLIDEPYDAGLVVIDLAARLVMVDSTYSSPGPTGTVEYHDGHCSTNIPLCYHLAGDWKFAHDSLHWQSLAESRRRERALQPPIDARAVFYGRPLLESLARGVFDARARLESTDEEAQDAIRDIHAAWMLTPRDDLGGACPRDVVMARHDHLMWDLEDQQGRWARLEECPPGLDESSFAYRYGGFGTHEMVEYYSLIRELLASSAARLLELTRAHPVTGGTESLTVGDFLTAEVPRLESVRDEWLDTPDWECHDRTPRSIIDRERARLPEGMCGHDAIVDPDCPCCQMMADLPGPAFWHLDGSEFDDDFAFDLSHETREEWEAEQREMEESFRRTKAQWDERKRLNLGYSGFIGDGAEAVWNRSFSVNADIQVPLGLRLFGIGGHLAELIADIRDEGDNGDEGETAPKAQQLIDELNRDFGNLREVLQSPEPELTEALLEPLIGRFTESLATVASTSPDLTKKCESLTIKLSRFLKPDNSVFDDDVFE